MSFKQKLAKKTDLKEDLLPSSYQIVGDILLVKFLKIKDLKTKKKIAAVFLEMIPHVKTVCEIAGVSGELRKPRVKILAGETTETVHREHGILYKLDVSKTMFSKGNLFERGRVARQMKPGEVVVDMFAGIGYFSIPIAKLAKPKKIYCIEKNPVSVKYLEENIKLNKIKNIEVIQGDCRKTKLPEKADRVIMGYLPKTQKFLPAAFRLVKAGGIIHYHDTFAKKELWERPLKILEKEAKKAGFEIKIIEKRKVKQYAPNVYHVVIDFGVRKL